MKTKSQLIRLVLATGMLFVFATAAHAGPGLEYWQTLRTQSQFLQLQKGDKVAFVCDGCKTVSEFTIASPTQAAELSNEGGTVLCPACKAVTKVVYVQKRQRNDPITRTIVTYVNDKGEECAFMATVPVSP